jgi:NADPH:quinone reductase-like Zn-dependent oxidoreductase
LDFCTKTLGCTAAFNTDGLNWDEEVTEAANGKGVDIIVDLIGLAVFQEISESPPEMQELF